METKKIILKCNNCNSLYLRYKEKNRPQKFCSQKCYLNSKENSETQRRRTLGKKAQKNLAWKGEKVSYKGLHRWIEIQLGQSKNYLCQFCKGKNKSKKMNWANLDHKYTRDLSKWVPLCKICHSRYDQKTFNSYSNKL